MGGIVTEVELSCGSRYILHDQLASLPKDGQESFRLDKYFGEDIHIDPLERHAPTRTRI